MRLSERKDGKTLSLFCTFFLAGKRQSPKDAERFAERTKTQRPSDEGGPLDLFCNEINQLRLRSTSLFLAIQGIMPRRRSPTSSIGWAAERARIALNEGWPALFSSTQSRAKRPV
jgi:hypothetical protein